MFTTNLRKVGGSVMLAVPPAILDVLHLYAGATVNLALEHDRLVIEPVKRPRYTLAELLAQCNSLAEINAEDRVWLDSQRAGNELL